MIRFVTAGESHGKSLSGVLEGLPAGLEIDLDFINLQLRRRQGGYGRGGRMQIERDAIDIIAGVRHGRTLGSPIAFLIHNRDWTHWEIPMSATPVPEGVNIRSVSRPRPGHVDLAGALKYQTYDIRNVLERASARETAARVAVGALCELYLRSFGVRVGSHVLAIGNCSISQTAGPVAAETIFSLDPESAVRCTDPHAAERMIALIGSAKEAGDTLGGVVEAIATAVPPGLGSHTQWDLRLDGLIAQAMMSIPAAKAVEIGEGIFGAREFGSKIHDEIFYNKQTRRFFRKTDRAGGVEGGIANGSDIRVRVFFKPIPTLRKPLQSVDVITKEVQEAAFERSDVCVVPAASVIAESMLAFVLARAFMEKFGGDSMAEATESYEQYKRMLDRY